MGLAAQWTQVDVDESNIVELTRSSHSLLSVVEGKVFLFGGELVPRIPLAYPLMKADLKDNKLSNVTLMESDATPSPRVGSALAASADSGHIYLWGGRGGKSMSTLDEDDLWEFNVASEQWTQLTTTGVKPTQRSFHVLTQANLYVHAGCPKSGRLAELHSLSLETLIWKQLPNSPEPGRGGSVLCPLISHPTLLVRYGGFAGHELGGALDIFDAVSNTWSSAILPVEGGGEAPEPRSVHSLVALDGSLHFSPDKVAVAVMSLGEREGAPAELGHDGAGFFHADCWALLSTITSPPTFSWLSLQHSKETSSAPRARGWFASDRLPNNRVLIQGGLNEKNERMGDAWILQVVVE